jgi:hypothetical protein
MVLGATAAAASKPPCERERERPRRPPGSRTPTGMDVTPTMFCEVALCTMLARSSTRLMVGTPRSSAATLGPTTTAGTRAEEPL